MLRRIWAFLVLLTFTLIAQPCWAERALSSSILPKETLLYARLTNVPEFVERFKSTGGGRMFSDPQLKPFVEHLYGKARDEVDQYKEKLGISLDELLQIPQGEIAIGVIPMKEEEPAVVFIIDTGNNAANAKKLIETLELQLQNAKRRELQIEGQTVVGIQNDDDEELFLLEKQGTFLLCTKEKLIPELLKNWSGREKDGIADNPRYAAVLASCRTKEQDPQFFWFVEPIALFRAFTAGDFGATLALNALPALGLDGLQAVGGSVAFDVDEFDLLLHAHLLLDNPRNGVLAALALGEGDLKPQPWVPSNVVGYFTFYWNFLDSYDQIEKLVDSFRGPGTTANELKRNLNDRWGVDLITDVLGNFTGRVSHVSRMPSKEEREAALPVEANVETQEGRADVQLGMQFGRGADQLWAIELKDTNDMQKVINRLLEKNEIADRVEKKSWAGHEYYVVKMPERREGRRGPPMQVEPCFAIARDCLIISDHFALLRDVLTNREEKETLGAALDYKLMTGKIKRQIGESKVGFIQFQRPDEGLKYFWDIALQEQTQKRLQEAGEGNRFFATLDEAVKKHPLPPFSALEKYFAPTGAVITNNDNGFHYLSFTLKRKIE
jgi:hypothetical protein